MEKIRLIILSGPSGSGKSSLAYDTIAKIGLQEYLSMFYDEMSDLSYKVDEYKNMSATVPIKQSNYNSNVKSTIQFPVKIPFSFFNSITFEKY